MKDKELLAQRRKALEAELELVKAGEKKLLRRDISLMFGDLVGHYYRVTKEFPKDSDGPAMAWDEYMYLTEIDYIHSVFDEREKKYYVPAKAISFSIDGYGRAYFSPDSLIFNLADLKLTRIPPATFKKQLARFQKYITTKAL